MNLFKANDTGSFAVLEQVAKLHHYHLVRLVALNPVRLEKLLETDDLALVQRYCPLAGNLITLRRSSASSLRNPDGSLISLRSIMPIHEVKTVELAFREEESVEYQWAHRAYARSYVNAVTRFKDSKTRLMTTGESFPIIKPALPNMTVITYNVVLARLRTIIRKQGRSTIVAELKDFRRKGINAHHFFKFA